MHLEAKGPRCLCDKARPIRVNLALAVGQKENL
jgi:hypothetical protein